MADFKRRTLVLTTGKQVKLFGNSIGIGRSLEIAEGYAPNILACITSPDQDKVNPNVSNPYNLSAEELQEVADLMIRLWMDLKENIRKYGISNPKIFNKDGLL